MRAYKGCEKPKLLTRKVALPPFSYATSKALTRREPFKPIRASSAAWPAWRAETDRQAAVCRTARPMRVQRGGCSAARRRWACGCCSSHLDRTSTAPPPHRTPPRRANNRSTANKRSLRGAAASPSSNRRHRTSCRHLIRWPSLEKTKTKTSVCGAAAVAAGGRAMRLRPRSAAAQDALLSFTKLENERGTRPSHGS